MVIIDYNKLRKENTGNNGNLNEGKFIEAVKAAGGTANNARQFMNGKQPANDAALPQNKKILAQQQAIADLDPNGILGTSNAKDNLLDIDIKSNKFKNLEPEVQSMVLAMQGNAVQSGIDGANAIALATANAGLSSALMTQTAQTELYNTTEIMAQEQQYGLAQMAAAAGIENTFADNQLERDLIIQAADQVNNQANMALAGAMELEQIQESLNLQGVNEQTLQGLVNSGALEQIAAAGANEETLQKLVNSGAIDQINAQNAGAVQQIIASGIEDRNLQKIVNSGAIDQINAQNAGAIAGIAASGIEDRNLQKLVNAGAIDQINAQNAGALAQLAQSGYDDRALQRLVNSGAIDQINAQNEGAIAAIAASGIEDRNLQRIVNDGALDQLLQQGLNAENLQNLIQNGDGGIMDQLDNQNAAAIAQIQQSGLQDRKLQELVNSGALDQIIQSGINDQQLQTLVQNGPGGIMDQLNNQNAATIAQMHIANVQEEKMMELAQSGAIAQIQEQGLEDERITTIDPER